MIELKPCPICGRAVRICGGPENWTPTFYDPDSGGDPYGFDCECGLSFSINSFDIEETAKAWNRRVSDGAEG